jgi:type II secretion system protein G
MLTTNRRGAGFTLLEVLVVVSILGMLSAIAIAAYTTYLDKGKYAQAYEDLRTIRVAIELLASDTERWPGPNPVGTTANQEVWNLNLGEAGLVNTNGAFPNWKGPYTDQVPQDPWGSNYFFDPDYTINGNTYVVIGSFGPNRVGPNLYDTDDLVLKLPTP